MLNWLPAPPIHTLLSPTSGPKSDGHGPSGSGHTHHLPGRHPKHRTLKVIGWNSSTLTKGLTKEITLYLLDSNSIDILFVSEANIGIDTATCGGKIHVLALVKTDVALSLNVRVRHNLTSLTSNGLAIWLEAAIPHQPASKRSGAP